MSTASERSPILTLEPLLEAVRNGVEEAGWTLSGLQKTTSHEFEGRWAGESTRSAYLFFHREPLPDWASVEAFLDETSKGLRGNLSLVVDGPELGALEGMPGLLADLARVAGESLPEGFRTPVTVRLRLPSPDADPSAAETGYRFKLHLPRTAIEAGASAVSALASAAVGAFETALAHPALAPHLPDDSR